MISWPSSVRFTSVWLNSTLEYTYPSIVAWLVSAIVYLPSGRLPVLSVAPFFTFSVAAGVLAPSAVIVNVNSASVGMLPTGTPSTTFLTLILPASCVYVFVTVRLLAVVASALVPYVTAVSSVFAVALYVTTTFAYFAAVSYVIPCVVPALSVIL